MSEDLRDKLAKLAKQAEDQGGDHADTFESAEKEELSKADKVDKFEKSQKEDKDKDTKTSKKDKSLQEKLKEAETKCAEMEDQYKRLMADYRNLSTRVNKEREDLHKYASVSTVEKLLPSVDNFDFALKSINENTKIEDAKKSIDILKIQLLTCLKSCGVEQIDSAKKFNPEFHEAVSTVKDSDKDEGTILEVVKEGYKIGDRVIRAALVVVSSKE